MGKNISIWAAKGSMPELASPIYDFDFIALSLGLIPISNHNAINPGAIISLEVGEGKTVITLHSDQKYYLAPEDLARLEDTIKRRSEEAKAIQKEAFKENIIAQQEVVNELNRLAQPMPALVGIPRKGRQ